MTVRDIFDYIDNFAPFASAASWDNSGLIVGKADDTVTKAVVCLDVNKSVIDYAASVNAELIISHHPVIFRAVKSFTDDNPAFIAANKGISIISAHTNLDKAADGVNDTLCRTLGFDFSKLSEDVCEGFLNIIDIPEGIASYDLVELLKTKLNAAVTYSCNADKLYKIAVCCGAGADFIPVSVNQGCDSFITGEASYHEFLDAQSQGISLFAAGHFETEVPVVKSLAEKLRTAFSSITFIEISDNNSICTET